jgi:hypothetical protein
MARDGFPSKDDERNDPVVARLLELEAASADARPRADIARRVGLRLDEHRVRGQLTVVLTAAALAACVSLVFWWDATSRLKLATVSAVSEDGSAAVTAFEDAEELEP